MKLTLAWLREKKACGFGVEWWTESKCETVETTMALLLEQDKLDWANWLIAHTLDHDGQIRYAIYAARQVLDIYEKQYPGDKRARAAIEAAETYLKDKTEENRIAADAAAYAADAAAAYAAYAADAAAAYAADAAAAAMKKKIIQHGRSLLQEAR
jgi:hypothetical protein